MCAIADRARDRSAIEPAAAKIGCFDDPRLAKAPVWRTPSRERRDGRARRRDAATQMRRAREATTEARTTRRDATPTREPTTR